MYGISACDGALVPHAFLAAMWYAMAFCQACFKATKFCLLNRSRVLHSSTVSDAQQFIKTCINHAVVRAMSMGRR